MIVDKMISFFEQITKSLEERRMRSELRRLRRKGLLDPFLDQTHYVVVSGDKADPSYYVFHKQTERNPGAAKFVARSKDEAIWSIVKIYAHTKKPNAKGLGNILSDRITRLFFSERLTSFLKRRQMRAGLKRLRAENKLDQILQDADYIIMSGDQGSDFLDVHRKGQISRGSELFSTLSRDEAIWWIVKRHLAETGSPDD